jgi:hypothetical protein
MSGTVAELPLGDQQPFMGAGIAHGALYKGLGRNRAKRLVRRWERW